MARHIRIKHRGRAIAASVAALATLSTLTVAACSSIQGDAMEGASLPAPAPCFAKCGTSDAVPFSFPFAGAAQKKAFDQMAFEPSGVQDFYGSFDAMVGAPLSVRLYLPPEDASDANLQGENFTTPGRNGEPPMAYRTAVVIAQNTTPAEIDALLSSGAGQQDRVSVAFSRAEPTPTRTTPFIRVLGYTSDVSRRISSTATLNLPVIRVGAWEPISGAEVKSPADKIAYPRITVRQGDIQASVDRVEYSPDETRVHMSMKNLGIGSDPASWDLSNARIILPNNTQYPPTPSESEEAFTPEGVAASTNSSDVVASGYLFFPAVNPSDELVLSLPTPSGAETMRIVIPPPPAT